MNNMTIESSSPSMAWSLHDMTASTYARLVDIAFDEDAAASELFLLVLFFAAVWFFVFYVVKSTIRPLVHNKKWLRDALERDFERSNTKKMLADMNMNMTQEEAITWSMNDWPRMQCIIIQHFVGSLFCLPSILGIGDPAAASSLAMFGILSEMGWELQDMLEVLFVRAFFKNGKDIWPDAIVAIFAVHHSLTTCLGVPMILFYRSNRSLHWMCFNLQQAAAVALAIGEYTKILDISDPSKLRRFKWMNGFALATMLWTRVIHYTYLCFDLWVTWYKDEAYWFLVIGLPLSVFFFLFSYFCVVLPFYRRFKKFLNVSAEYEALPKDAAVEKRRSSVVKLDLAVAELLDEDELVVLSELVEPIFAKRRPTRRHSSIPTQSRKRRSLVMMRAHSFHHGTSKEL